MTSSIHNKYTVHASSGVVLDVVLRGFEVGKCWKEIKRKG